MLNFFIKDIRIFTDWLDFGRRDSDWLNWTLSIFFKGLANMLLNRNLGHPAAEKDGFQKKSYLSSDYSLHQHMP